MHTEALIPVLRTSPQREMLSLRCEGVSPIETFYEGQLFRTKQEGYHLIYLCAPLKATEGISAWWNIQKALTAASSILGARWKGKDTSLKAEKLSSMKKAFDYYEALLTLSESNRHNFFVP